MPTVGVSGRPAPTLVIDGAEDVGGVTGPASVSSQVIDTQELMLRSGVAFASGDQWVLAWGPRVVYVFHRASNSSATRAGLPSGLPPRLGAMSPGADTASVASDNSAANETKDGSLPGYRNQRGHSSASLPKLGPGIDGSDTPAARPSPYLFNTRVVLEPRGVAAFVASASVTQGDVVVVTKDGWVFRSPLAVSHWDDDNASLESGV